MRAFKNKRSKDETGDNPFTTRKENSTDSNTHEKSTIEANEFLEKIVKSHYLNSTSPLTGKPIIKSNDESLEKKPFEFGSKTDNDTTTDTKNINAFKFNIFGFEESKKLPSTTRKILSSDPNQIFEKLPSTTEKESDLESPNNTKTKTKNGNNEQQQQQQQQQQQVSTNQQNFDQMLAKIDYMSTNLTAKLNDLTDIMKSQLKLQQMKCIYENAHIGSFRYHSPPSNNPTESKVLVEDIIRHFTLGLSYKLKDSDIGILNNCFSMAFDERKEKFLDRLSQHLRTLIGHTPRFVQNEDQSTSIFYE